MSARNPGLLADAREILHCDRCGEAIEDLLADIAFPGDHYRRPRMNTAKLDLLCKKNGCARVMRLSLPLEGYADPAVGLASMAAGMRNVALSANDWKRFARIVWAAGYMATAKQAAQAREQHGHLSSLGMID